MVDAGLDGAMRWFRPQCATQRKAHTHTWSSSISNILESDRCSLIRYRPRSVSVIFVVVSWETDGSYRAGYWDRHWDSGRDGGEGWSRARLRLRSERGALRHCQGGFGKVRPDTVCACLPATTRGSSIDINTAFHPWWCLRFLVILLFETNSLNALDAVVRHAPNPALRLDASSSVGHRLNA